MLIECEFHGLVHLWVSVVRNDMQGCGQRRKHGMGTLSCTIPCVNSHSRMSERAPQATCTLLLPLSS